VLRQLSDDGRARCRRVHSTLEAAFRVRNDTSWARLGRADMAWAGRGELRLFAQDLELAAAAFARLKDLEQPACRTQRTCPAVCGSLCRSWRAGAVRIMNIHTVQGLEFDMVVLPAPTATSAQPRSIARVASIRSPHRPRRHGDAARPAHRRRYGDRLFEFYCASAARCSRSRGGCASLRACTSPKAAAVDRHGVSRQRSRREPAAAADGAVGPAGAEGRVRWGAPGGQFACGGFGPSWARNSP